MTMDSFSKQDIKFLFRGFSVSSLFYNFLIETMPKIGVDIGELEIRTRYKIIPILDGERISFVKVYRLWIEIERILNRSDTGLLIADYFTPSKAGIIGELFLGTKNLKESVFIMKRFLSLIISNISIRYEEVDDDVIFYFDVVPRFIMPFSVTECYAKICYNWIREYNNTSDLSIKEISYYAPKPEHSKFYELNFPKVQVSFKQSENFIVLEKKIFYERNERKMVTHYDYILKHAENIKNNLLNASTLTQKIINEILMDMPEGKCHIDNIAENLNLSTSSVKRKLKEQNTNFKKLVELIRKDLSTSMLKDDNITYEEISYLLGYSEYSPFFRAFKKWYRCSPSAYKENF